MKQVFLPWAFLLVFTSFAIASGDEKSAVKPLATTPAPTAAVTPVATQAPHPVLTPPAAPQSTPTFVEPPAQQQSLAAKLRQEMESVLAKGPLHFRTRGKGSSAPQILMSWEPENGGTLRVLEISALGEIVRDFSKRAFSSKEFLDALFQKDARLETAGSFSAAVREPLSRAKLDTGATTVSAALDFSFPNSITVRGVQMFFDVLVMNFNPLNLWDANPRNTAPDRMYGYDLFTREFSNWYDPKVQEAKAQSLVRVLKLAALPEVVALQEIEYAGGNSEVFAFGSPLRVELEKLGYRSFLVGKQGPENPVAITTAFIGRYNLLEHSSLPFNIRDEAFQIMSERERNSVRFSTRDTQVAELALGVSRARFFNTHWRSKGCSGEESCDVSERVRLVNAQVLRRHIDSMNKAEPNVEIFVMGDFNSAYDDVAVQRVGSTAEKRKISRGEMPQGLYNLWYELPIEARWEHEFQGERNTLSQMLLAPAFFGSVGFQYVDLSFEALGQQGEAHRVLMNPNDTPLRWQEARLKLEEAPHGKREAIKSLLTSRGCFEAQGDAKNSEGKTPEKKKPSKRKCGAAYTEHVGVGYSDHLPQVARLAFVGDDSTEVAAQYSEKPRSDLAVVTTKRCEEKNAAPVSTVEFWNLDNKGKCVVLDFAGAPQPLRTRGIYEFGYVIVKGSMLGITMSGAYNPKPKKMFGGEKSSDMCFARNVLQHEGGKILKAVGRLGFDNGMPVVFLAERDDVSFFDLPKEKKERCE